MTPKWKSFSFSTIALEILNVAHLLEITKKTFSFCHSSSHTQAHRMCYVFALNKQPNEREKE